MNELKAFSSERIYWAVEQVERVAGDIDELHLDDNLFCIKSDVDKVIAELKNEIEEQKRLRDMALASVPNVLKVMKIIQHHKYSHCMGNAWLCKKLSKAYAWFASTHRGWKANAACDRKAELWRKWVRLWMELAKKFKETKQ